MAVPEAETPPQGLDAYWLGVWRHALKVMKSQGTWAWELKPLLDEYVFALIAAVEARVESESARWDRHAKRASGLADQLALTPRGRKAIALVSDDDAIDPFAEIDELAVRRAS